MLRVLTAFVFGSLLGFFIFNSGIKPILATDTAPKPIPSATTVSTPIETPINSPSPSETPSPTPIPTPKPTPKLMTPTPIPTPTPSPIPTFTHQHINELIQNTGSQYGIDPNVLRHIALCESEFNPLAKNGPYWGLYQFGSITWQNFRYAMKEDPSINLRLNAEEAIQTAAYALSLGKTHIWPNCYPN